jgi:hypothetical protein
MTHQLCVMCNHPYDIQTITLEQKIVEDQDFCTRCWTEVMETEWLDTFSLFGQSVRVQGVYSLNRIGTRNQFR